VTEPFVAVMVMVSPTEPTIAEMEGVESLVTLSVLDAPVSDEVSKSGAVGVVGFSRSMVILVAGLESDCSPFGLARTAVTNHVPVVRNGMVHDVAAPTT